MMWTCYVHRHTTIFCQVLLLHSWDCYTSKVTAIVSVTLTATDIQGADLSKPLVFFWHRHREGAWNKLATETLSWLSFISDMLSHLTLLSRWLGNRWKEAPGFWLGLLSQLIMYVQAYCIVLDHTSTDFHSSHIIVNVQVSCLSPWLRTPFKAPTC